MREQLEGGVEAAGGLPGAPYDVADNRLVVWPGAGFDVELSYDLGAAALPVTVRGAATPARCRPSAGQRAVFAQEPMATAAWATTWERLALGMEPAPLVTGPTLLPVAS